MSENVNVNPTPIQRNSADVAVELLNIYYRVNAINDENEIANIYSKFYATAEFVRLNYRNLNGLVPEEILNSVKR